MWVDCGRREARHLSHNGNSSDPKRRSVIFVVDEDCSPIIKQEGDLTAVGSGRHLVALEAMTDHASGSANIGMRIIPALALDRPRRRNAVGLPPDYRPAIDDEFMPRTCEAEVDDIGTRHKFALADEALAD